MAKKYQLTETQTKFLQSTALVSKFQSGLGGGKSFSLTLWALLQGLKHRHVLYILPTNKMLRDVTIPTMNSHIEHLGLKCKVTLSTPTITFPDSTTIYLRSAESYDALRGINVHDLCVDEAGYVKREAYLIAQGRARLDNAPLEKLVGTPNGSEHWFSKISQGDDVDCFLQTTMQNPFLSKTYKDKLIKSYGGLSSKWARQELLGEAVDMSSDDQMISPGTVFISRQRRTGVKGRRILSVDPARLGGDSSGFAVLDGERLIHLSEIRNLEGPELLEHVKAKILEFSPDVLIVDVAGLGATWLDFAKQTLHGITIEEHHNGHASTNPKLWYNKRAETFDKLNSGLRDTLDMSTIPADIFEKLKAELMGVRKMYNGGKLQVESKENAKKRGVKSPNLADALSMAVLYMINNNETDANDTFNNMYGGRGRY